MRHSYLLDTLIGTLVCVEGTQKQTGNHIVRCQWPVNGLKAPSLLSCWFSSDKGSQTLVAARRIGISSSLCHNSEPQMQACIGAGGILEEKEVVMLGFAPLHGRW